MRHPERTRSDAGMQLRGHGLLIFDGDCAFCSLSVRWLMKRSAVRPASWQSAPLERLGLAEDQVRTRVWLLADDGTVLASGARAFAWVLSGSPQRTWRLAGLILGWPIVRSVASRIYGFVARHRHQMPGGTASCKLLV
ncbi:thiol-disulfide oxidoreductase DCC family protein [Microbacterium azadirachtae]|uniref:thiol-disulfide oxidoreductase DCC family protein n=1 Tax=Microbacterium azadirachtae TaxID=582680 RepID=UPI0009E228EF